MAKVDREGTFKGRFVEHGVGLTKNEYPQLVGDILLTEYYNEDTGEWEAWEDFDQHTYPYLVLFGKDNKATLNCQQVKTALGWDGNSFTSLSEMDLSETVFQVRIELDFYKDTEQLKVNWIDHKDVEPGRKVSKLDAAKVKSLDAKYTNKLGSTPAPSKPKGDKPKPKPTTGKTKKKAAPPSTGKKKAPAPAPATGCTKDEAWDAIQDVDTVMNEQQVGEVWLATIDAVSSGGGEKELTGNGWATVKKNVIEKIGIPF